MTSSLNRRDTLLAVGGLMLVLFLVSLDQTIVGTAMPRVIADLQGFALYAWVTTAYLLAETAVIPVVGKLGDQYGRKWLTVAGVAVFLVGSVLCGIANSMLQLIIFRGIQGLGGGMLLATTFALIADIFPDPTQRAKYQGMFFAVFGLSSVIGPVLGGAITDALGWRWIFYVNLPLGLFALAVLPRVLPQTQRQGGGRVDYLGAVVATLAVVALLLSLSWAGAGRPWSSPQIVGGLVLALVLGALFIPIERRAAEPIIPLGLFRNRALATASVVMFLVGIAMFGIILYTPLFVQGVLGRTATGSGAVLTPLVLTMTVMGIVGGQLLARLGRVRPLLLFGTGMMALGAFLLTRLGVETSVTTVAVYLFVTALGLGTIMPTTTLAVQTAVDPRELGVATSATQFIRSIGSTVGTAVIGTFVTSGYVRGLQAGVPAGTPPELLQTVERPDALVSPEALGRLSDTAVNLPNGQGLVEQLLGVARASLADALYVGFLVVFVAAALAVAASLLMPDVRIDKQQVVPAPPEAASADGSAAVGVQVASVEQIGEPEHVIAVGEPRHRG